MLRSPIDDGVSLLQICRAASMPFKTGMAKSMTTMSGRCCSASATASRPSAASAATQNPAWLSSNRRRPFLTIVWSSARRIRMILILQPAFAVAAGDKGNAARSNIPSPLADSTMRRPPSALTRSSIPIRPIPLSCCGLNPLPSSCIDNNNRSGSCVTVDRKSTRLNSSHLGISDALFFPLSYTLSLHDALPIYQAHPPFLLWIEPPAIVLYRQQQSVRLLRNRDGHIPGVRVLNDVVQRLLNDAINARLVIFREFVGDLLGCHLRPYPAPLGCLAGLPLQGRNKTEIVEHGGTQQQGHVTDDADRPFEQPLDFVGFLRQSGFLPVADQIREICHLHQHAGERLPHLIVQFARDQLPLFFLRLQKTGGQLLQFGPGMAHLPVVLGDRKSTRLNS